jgi:TetR/AcrR family transcriptional repressor of nem operon
METFWRLGYQTTSMKDLVEATGLSTRSMYNMFESKSGLFKATLIWYHDQYLSARYEKMMEASGTAALRTFFLSAAAFMESNGCFFVNTMSDRHGIDQDCLAIADDHFHQLEQAFRLKLKEAQELEGYQGDLDLRTKQLAILFQGISVSSKKGDPEKISQRAIGDLLSQLGIE